MNEPCVHCGHADSRHDELGLCTECNCVHYVGQDDDDDETDGSPEELDFDDQA